MKISEVKNDESGNVIELLMDGKKINLPKDFVFSKLNQTLKSLPEIGFDPHSERVVVIAMDMQDRIFGGTAELPMIAPSSVKINVQSAVAGIGHKEASYRKKRYIIIKASKKFSELASGDPNVVLQRGDEVILAEHLDGLPSAPIVTDPMSYKAIAFQSFHYTEISGYIKHNK